MDIDGIAIRHTGPEGEEVVVHVEEEGTTQRITTMTRLSCTHRAMAEVEWLLFPVRRRVYLQAVNDVCAGDGDAFVGEDDDGNTVILGDGPGRNVVMQSSADDDYDRGYRAAPNVLRLIFHSVLDKLIGSDRHGSGYWDYLNRKKLGYYDKIGSYGASAPAKPDGPPIAAKKATGLSDEDLVNKKLL